MECALFLATISKNTDARRGGCYRRERKLAIERTHDMAEGVPCIVSVVVDDILEAPALVPARCQQVRWMRLPGARPSPKFGEQVKRRLAAPRRAVEGRREQPTPPDDRDLTGPVVPRSTSAQEIAAALEASLTRSERALIERWPIE